METIRWDEIQPGIGLQALGMNTTPLEAWLEAGADTSKAPRELADA